MPPSIGSSGGIAAVASGTAVLGRIARPLSDKDKALGLIATPVFRLPATIFVHPSAKVEELTVQQLAGIFSGAITNWNEVGGADLRIRVIRREEGESALSTIRASLPVFKDLAITPRSKLESTTPAAFETLLATEGAIFIASYSTSAVARGAVPLCIEGRKPLDGGYPATLTIGFVHREETVTPEARVFLAFATSAKARDAIMKAGSAVPVN
jgi:phosphate transport system substrate-binding protein